MLSCSALSIHFPAVFESKREAGKTVRSSLLEPPSLRSIPEWGRRRAAWSLLGIH